MHNTIMILMPNTIIAIVGSNSLLREMYKVVPNSATCTNISKPFAKAALARCTNSYKIVCSAFSTCTFAYTVLDEKSTFK